MKKIFYLGLAGLAVFEVARVYLIMPLPGSQAADTVGVAYVLHVWRWAFRAAAVVAIVVGARAAFGVRWRWRWLAIGGVAGTAAVAWMFNFRMTAERMFREPRTVAALGPAESTVPADSLVLGVEINGEARAWPIRYLVYHHQVRDVVGGKPVMATYCSVCRTGRVFEPVVDGRPERFRLVGMDRFNAMFEDAGTKSWWRQATGEAVAGPLAGARLPEVRSWQMSAREWFALHPDARVMQPDPDFVSVYDAQGRFERGESRGALTRTDPASWGEKSWVVGVRVGDSTRAYDWRQLRERGAINDVVAGTPIVVATTDEGGFVAFRRPSAEAVFAKADGGLRAGERRYDFAGRAHDGAGRLEPIPAYQEFWHSWRTFQPRTERAD